MSTVKVADPSLRDLVRDAERAGWVTSRTSKGHLRFQAPGGTVVFTSGTPGDRRVVNNSRSQLNRVHPIDPDPGKNLEARAKRRGRKPQEARVHGNRPQSGTAPVLRERVGATLADVWPERHP